MPCCHCAADELHLPNGHVPVPWWDAKRLHFIDSLGADHTQTLSDTPSFVLLHNCQCVCSHSAGCMQAVGYFRPSAKDTAAAPAPASALAPASTPFKEIQGPSDSPPYPATGSEPPITASLLRPKDPDKVNEGAIAGGLTAAVLVAAAAVAIFLTRHRQLQAAGNKEVCRV
jgi:hypothetical protein